MSTVKVRKIPYFVVEYCELFVFFQQNFIMVLGSIAGLFPIQIVPTIICPILMVPSSQLEMVAITGENQRRKMPHYNINFLHSECDYGVVRCNESKKTSTLAFYAHH